ncbi:hypothetical protein [Labilithrix luteola]|uniref:hypothetical protein n=1 Tax=Labilithrix luteola TaxID=1391654 RepID=UPI0011BAB4D6|nr:hypothetical protein [Labilithrix luteola]
MMERSIRSCLVAVVVTSLLAIGSSTRASADDSVTVESDGRGAAACIPADKCCRVCDAGRACGNSCISASKQCHKGRGCSCNAEEICATP